MSLEGELRRIIGDQPARVVWVIGSGVPQGALQGTASEPYTSWVGLLRSGLQRLCDLGRITADEQSDHERLLGHNNLNSWLGVAELVAQELGAPGGGEFRRWLRETVGEFEKHVADHGVLAPLAAHQRRGGLLATTNYDLLLESATGLPTVTWQDPANVERALRGDEPQILHLHGAWRSPESVVLGIRSYEDVVRDPHARAVLTTLRTNHTFVFVGCGAGLRDPNLGSFLSWTASVYGGSEYRHFRLCRKSELAALRAEHPDEQRIFPLSYGDEHKDLAPFLHSLLPTHGTTGSSITGSSSIGLETAPPVSITPIAPIKPRGPGTSRGMRAFLGRNINGASSSSLPEGTREPAESPPTEVPTATGTSSQSASTVVSTAQEGPTPSHLSVASPRPGRKTISRQVMYAVALQLDEAVRSHSKINALFSSSGAPGEAPNGNLTDKMVAWLKMCNDASDCDPLTVLGGVLEPIFERPENAERADKVRRVLAAENLRYEDGKILPS